ncbi:TetR/AcrR family transcriptional regulator [Sporosarcina sp. P16b]|uniref:TetR/AcrR family transcriptional regulator n=1 Tax=Sporosarcina sp. P16b TaxID=2048261 RepID=UPI00130452CC|nr:TetR/AcrR family transcriptional regulator [Sporosarcina sp. P16b]
MSERKILIIEKASELFAIKGFNATSIQDITDACGISKGSFYLSFKSKDSLLISIFEYFRDKLMDRMSGLNDSEITPRKRLELFFSIQFEEIAKYSDFILMHMREQTNPINDEMVSMVNDMRQKTYELQEKILLDVYGDEIKEYITDLFVLLSGFVKGYIEIIIFNKDALNYNDLASFIVDRTDSLVNGLTVPFLRKEQLVGFELEVCGTSITKNMLIEEIELLESQITNEDAIISLDVIKQELTSEDCRKPVIIGMMSNLKNYENANNLMQKIKQFLLNTQ